MKASPHISNVNLNLTISIDRGKCRCERQTVDPTCEEQELLDNEERQLRFVRQRAEIDTIVRDRQLRTVMVYAFLLMRAGASVLAATAVWLAVLGNHHPGLAVGSVVAFILAVARRPILTRPV